MESDEIVVNLLYRAPTLNSLTERAPGIRPSELNQYDASPETQSKALRILGRLGFRIIVSNSRGISISGTGALVKKTFGHGDLKIPDELATYIEAASVQSPGEFY